MRKNKTKYRSHLHSILLRTYSNLYGNFYKERERSGLEFWIASKFIIWIGVQIVFLEEKMFNDDMDI